MVKERGEVGVVVVVVVGVVVGVWFLQRWVALDSRVRLPAGHQQE